MRDRDDLRDAQREIVNSITGSCDQMIVAGMGGGKTAATLTALADLKVSGDVRQGIMLAPPLVAATVWTAEVERWAHLRGFRVEHLSGGPAARESRMRSSTADLLTCSLHQTKWLGGVLEKLPDGHPVFDFLGIDEISFFTDPQGANAKALAPDQRARPGRRIAKRFRARIGLTGTPRPNGWEDVYMPMEILSGQTIWKDAEGEHQNFSNWRLDNFRPLSEKGYAWRIHRFAERELEAKLKPWVTSIDVGDLGLPPLSSGEDWDYVVKLSEEAQAAYDEMLKDKLVQVGFTGNVDEDFIVAMSAGVQSGKLSQIAQGFLYEQADPETGEVSGLAASYQNVKLDLLRKLVADRPPSDPVLLAYHYRADLDAMREILPGLPALGSGTSTKQAKRFMDEWNAGELPALAIHPFSAAHGIELQHGPGREIWWYCPTWSAERYDQLIKRIQRPGQKWPCLSRRFVAEGTLDEIKVARVEGKMAEEEAWRQLFRKKGII